MCWIKDFCAPLEFSEKQHLQCPYVSKVGGALGEKQTFTKKFTSCSYVELKFCYRIIFSKNLKIYKCMPALVKLATLDSLMKHPIKNPFDINCVLFMGLLHVLLNIFRLYWDDSNLECSVYTCQVSRA